MSRPQAAVRVTCGVLYPPRGVHRRTSLVRGGSPGNSVAVAPFALCLQLPRPAARSLHQRAVHPEVPSWAIENRVEHSRWYRRRMQQQEQQEQQQVMTAFAKASTFTLTNGSAPAALPQSGPKECGMGRQSRAAACARPLLEAITKLMVEASTKTTYTGPPPLPPPPARPALNRKPKPKPLPWLHG